MRKRVKVVLKSKDDDSDGSDLEGIDQIDWVESQDAKKLLGTGLFLISKYKLSRAKQNHDKRTNKIHFRQEG